LHDEGRSSSNNTFEAARSGSISVRARRLRTCSEASSRRSGPRSHRRDFWVVDPAYSLDALVGCPGSAVDIQRATCNHAPRLRIEPIELANRLELSSAKAGAGVWDPRQKSRNTRRRAVPYRFPTRGPSMWSLTSIDAAAAYSPVGTTSTCVCRDPAGSSPRLPGRPCARGL
jgi:hypothetical protein